MRLARQLLKRVFLGVMVVILAAPLPLVMAQTRTNLEALDDAGPRTPQLTVCSQNLQMYGRFSEVRPRLGNITPEEFREREAGLVRRMVSARCDVIAVQELVARNDDKAYEVVELLAHALRRGSGRVFQGKAGFSNDEGLRNGILVARDRGKIENLVSYHRAELPKLSEDQKPRFFGRGPLEAQIRIQPRGEAASKLLTVINFHFKSRAGGADDPTGLGWETYRMEMAEALRRIVLERHQASMGGAGGIVVLAGDRNADFDSATARILEGVLELEDFKTGAPCRLGKRGTPLCQAGHARPAVLSSTLTLDPETSLIGGTYQFGAKKFWLDDILLPSAATGFGWTSATQEGDFDSGVVSEPEGASDHALVYTRLYW
jgi:hypothetical protein